MLSKKKIKDIQSLCQKRQRDREKLFIAEGSKIVGELLMQKYYKIDSLYCLDYWANTNRHLLEGQTIEIITEWELEKISALQHPSQVLALVHYADPSPFPQPVMEWILVLDGIQDPGNLGTMVRTADWFGIQHLVCSMDTADLYNPKVIQASMGSFLRVKMIKTDLAIFLAGQKNIQSFAAVMDGIPSKNFTPLDKGILLIGNEGNGIRQDLLQFVQHKVTIPAIGKAESLNAGVATGILLSQFVKGA